MVSFLLSTKTTKMETLITIRPTYWSFLIILLVGHAASKETNKEISTHILYDKETILCNKSEAVNYIKKTKISGPGGVDFQFTIKCSQLNVCNETCEWSSRCTKKRYGSGVYVGGFQSLYDPYYSTRYLVLLCCNSSGNSGHCGSPWQTENEEYEYEAEKNQIFRIMGAAGRLDEKPWIKVKSCTYSQNETNDVCVSEERSLSVLPGLAGISGLAGLAGIALLQFGGAGGPGPPPAPLPP